MDKKTLLITPGDPSGLGPELVCRQLSRQPFELGPGQRLLILCPESVLELYCGLLGLKSFWSQLNTLDELTDSPSGIYAYAPQELQGFRPQPGVAEVRGGRVAAASLLLAVELLRGGEASGLVTGPLNKAMLMRAGYSFPGHTEFLAVQSGLAPENVCMHLAGSELRVSLATTHIPLRQVPEVLSVGKVLSCLRLTWEHLARLGLTGAPLAVCGLNPHAGEEGELGSEDQTVIAPAIRQARQLGVDAVGPLPADTVFYRARQADFSAVLAMYHDQGLAPLKLLHFGQAVNVTLGLPFVRVSVDHGTGYELVGTGRAGLGSLQRAIQMAWRLMD